MNFSAQLTPRDKKLLVGLIAFIIVAGFGWFFIRPAVAEMADLDTQMIVCTAQKQMTQQKIDGISGYEQALTQAADEFSQNTAPFYAQMPNRQIDQTLTLLALGSGFAKTELKELVISGGDSAVLLDNYLSQKTLTQDDALAGVYAADVKFVLGAQRSKLEAFIDVLANNCKGIRIVSYTFSANRADPQTQYLTLNLQLFMTDAAAEQQQAQLTLQGTN